MKIRPDSPAFPPGSDLGPASNITDGGYGGLTIRAYFAGLAMQGMCADSGIPSSVTPDVLAKFCTAMADAIIKELNKEPCP